MALSASVLGDLIKTKMMDADSTITSPEMVESFANALADAIVTHITAAGQVIIPAGAIATTGSAAAQSGPAVPVPLTIT